MHSVPLLLAAAAAYAALARAAFGRWRASRLSASRWLAVVFSSLTVSAVLAIALERGEAAWQLHASLLVGTFAVYLATLVRFADALREQRGWVVNGVDTAVIVTTLTTVGWSVGVIPSPALFSAMALLLGTWVAAHTIAGHVVRIEGRRLGSYAARSRSRAMLAGLIGMGSVLGVPTVLGRTPTEAILLGLVSAGCLWLGFAPPRSIQWMWQRRDVLDLTAAELRFAAAPDIDTLQSEMLPVIARLADADACWLTDTEEVLAVVGASTASAVRSTPWSLPREVAVTTGADAWTISVPAGDGLLVLKQGARPVLFGAMEGDALTQLASRVVSALNRADLERRERQAEARLAEARHLETVAVLKDDVLSTLSHELRTPLVSVLSASELVLNRWEQMPDEQRHLLVSRAHANAGVLHEVIEGTLRLAELRSSDVQPERSRVDVGRVAREVVAAVDADVRLAVRTGAQAVADEDVVADVLRELIANAAKFGGEGTITLTVRDRLGMVELEVADQGPGMSPEDAIKAVEPFHRTGDVLTRSTRGLGVGLTLAHELTRRSGGTLKLTSTPGEGTVARLTFPIATAVDPEDDVAALTP